MEKSSKHIALLILLLLNLSPAGKLLAQMENATLPREKIYAHVDRSFYLTGETVHCKLYIYDAVSNLPIQSSKVTYAELINSHGEMVDSMKIPLDSGFGSASLYLPLEMSSGNYLLRFYTRWMRNFSEQAFYTTALSIVNPFVDLKPPKPSSSSNIDIQFFPEGGEMVHNLTAKVGVKATKEGENGVDFKGFIIDKVKDTVAQFSSLRFGMGSFSFTPQPDEIYTALVQIADSVYAVELPEAKERGIATALRERESEVTVEITKSPHLALDKVLINLRSTTGKDSTWSVAINDTGGKTSISIIEMPYGISAFTVLDPNGRALAERLYFRKPVYRMLELSAKPKMKTVGRREKVEFLLESQTAPGTQVPGNFSVSVFRTDSLAQFSHVDMLSYVWLTSHLKGKVEAPLYYFHSDEDILAQATENLMLCQGWRRFVETPDSITFIPELETHILEISVTHTGTGKPAQGIPALLSLPGKDFKLYTSKSDENGSLRFLVNDFRSSEKILLSLYGHNAKDYNFSVVSPYIGTSGNSLPALALDSSQRQALETHSLNMQVTNVFSPKNERVPTKEDTLSFFGEPDKTYFLDNYTRFRTMQEVLIEYVYDVRLRKTREDFQLFLYEEPMERYFDTPPLMLLNGVPLSDPDELIALDPLKIEKIELVTRQFLSGSLFFNGIISLSTYDNASLKEITKNAGFERNLQGLATEREFYAPRYPSSDLQKRIPDYRNLLYWNPRLSWNLEDPKKIEFYTGDGSGKFLLVLQGVTADGKIGYATASFSVAAASKGF